jgi:hypothetical protein
MDVRQALLSQRQEDETDDGQHAANEHIRCPGRPVHQIGKALCERQHKQDAGDGERCAGSRQRNTRSLELADFLERLLARQRFFLANVVV